MSLAPCHSPKFRILQGSCCFNWITALGLHLLFTETFSCHNRSWVYCVDGGALESTPLHFGFHAIVGFKKIISCLCGKFNSVKCINLYHLHNIFLVMKSACSILSYLSLSASCRRKLTFLFLTMNRVISVIYYLLYVWYDKYHLTFSQSQYVLHLFISRCCVRRCMACCGGQKGAWRALIPPSTNGSVSDSGPQSCWRVPSPSEPPPDLSVMTHQTSFPHAEWLPFLSL